MENWSTLHERVQAEMNAADPYGRFEFVSLPKLGYDFVLQIGHDSCGFSRIDFSINGDGWVTAISQGPSNFVMEYQGLNPVGPAIAACFGVAQAFKKAIGQPPELFFQNSYFSAFDLTINSREVLKPTYNPTIPEIIDLERALMVGVGSVGSAFLYFLRMLSTKGTITFIDHDIVKPVNLNRSPIFGISNCGDPKVEVGCRYFFKNDLIVIPFKGTYNDYLKNHGRQKNGIDMLFPLANEDNVRWTIEHNFPPLMIYGTTTQDWGVNFGRHIPFVEDCLACRYPEEKKDIQFVCSKGSITDKKKNKNIDAALPFSSSLSALLMIAEVIKTQFEGYPFNENFIYLDLKGRMERVIKYQRKPRKGCFCVYKNKKIFKTYNELTGFASLSIKSI